MEFIDRKYVARIKNSPYFLLFSWNKIPSEENTGSQCMISFHYQFPNPDLGNVSIYAAQNILEEDLMYAGLNGLDASLVEIVEVEVNYKIKE